MPFDVADVRRIVERACARPDVLDACHKRDLGIVIEVLGSHGLTQGRMASLTGIPQGRLSQYKNHKVIPRAKTIFEDFANGLMMPSSARQALGLSPGQSATARTDKSAGNAVSDVGLEYPDAPAEAVDNVARLWRADLDSNRLIAARLEPAAWKDASLRWLVGAEEPAGSEKTSGVRIGTADVTRFRDTVELFDRLDGRFGGGHARQALVQYLHTDASRLLHGRYTDSVGRELFSATAQATLLIGFSFAQSVFA